MKRFIIALFFGFVANFSFADQLAYISKEEAMIAAEIIQEARTVYSYCGCCDGVKPQKLKVDKIIVRYTGYKSYYEVIIISKGKEYPLDMAYTWVKKEKAYQTVGEVAGFPHEVCKRIPK